MAAILSQSQREYKIVFIESDDISIEKVNVSELVKLTNGNGSDYEWKYAISEVIDKVLDLKQHEHMTFQSNRDNPNSLAIILRWK